MDMPQDTPIKPHHHNDQHYSQNNDSNSSDQNFSSFDSNTHKHEDHNNMKQSSLSIDENGYKNLQTHRQKVMNFPQMPSQLGKLYQIYLHNVNRKNQLKKIIQQLIEKQITAIRIAYDKEAFSIEEFIDLDQESKDYLVSKENYEKRQKQLLDLDKQYRQLKIMQVQNLLVLDPIMKNCLSKYTAQTKQIINTYFYKKHLFFLTKQKQRCHRIRKLKQNKGTKKQLKSEQQNEQQSLKMLEKGMKSRNTSRTVSEDQNQNENQKYRDKYLIRSFNFFKTQHGVSYEPHWESLSLPEKNYIGFLLLAAYSDVDNKYYVAYEQKRLYILTSKADENPVIQQQFTYDSPIIFCTLSRTFTHLYIGTQDGIIRKYNCTFQPPIKLTLTQIILCTIPNIEPEPITHIATTSNPDILLFAKKDILYEINLTNYTTYLLSQLPQPIQYMDQRLIITQNCVYLDYYTSGVSGIGHGKAVLVFNAKLKGMAKNRNIVRVHQLDGEDFVVFDQGDGVFAVEKLSKESTNSKN